MRFVAVTSSLNDVSGFLYHTHLVTILDENVVNAFPT